MSLLPRILSFQLSVRLIPTYLKEEVAVVDRLVVEGVAVPRQVVVAVDAGLADLEVEGAALFSRLVLNPILFSFPSLIYVSTQLDRKYYEQRGLLHLAHGTYYWLWDWKMAYGFLPRPCSRSPCASHSSTNTTGLSATPWRRL